MNLKLIFFPNLTPDHFFLGTIVHLVVQTRNLRIFTDTSLTLFSILFLKLPSEQ